MPQEAERLSHLLAQLAVAAEQSGRPVPDLLAVSKTREAYEIAALHAAGQQAFGENYVQEALGKMRELAHLDIEWHLIGHLQSNKASDVAIHFDWVESVDRVKLVGALGRHRPASRAPLNVLVQVNIDDERSKHGCAPADAEALCAAIDAEAHLRLRGLMAIPAPAPDVNVRRVAFRDMRKLFDRLRDRFPTMDTLSMGMSDDADLAIHEGSTQVRIGTALFGPRPLKNGEGLS